MKLEIIYTQESEQERLKYTLSKLDFYASMGHPLNLPSGTTVSSSSDDILAAAEKEFPSQVVLKAKDSILSGWQEHSKLIMQYIESLTFEVPKSIKLILTQYGAGGSYNVNACEIIVNVNYKADPLSILVHEITHLIVDNGLVHKFGLNHEDKENLIKWLISNSVVLKGFIHVPTRTPIKEPPAAALNELAKRNYIAV